MSKSRATNPGQGLAPFVRMAQGIRSPSAYFRGMVRAEGSAGSFRERVLAIVSAVPRGRVVTYGQVAGLAGRPRAAREVGWIAHGGAHGLPWHRVVNRAGGLAIGYTGGRRGHRAALEAEGVRVSEDYTVDLARYQWHPDERALARIGLIRAGNGQ